MVVNGCSHLHAFTLYGTVLHCRLLGSVSGCILVTCPAERMQRVAATAPNIGAVQEALALAFPPSQGSPSRAEKFKQFFADVMPPGSKLKVLGYSLWLLVRLAGLVAMQQTLQLAKGVICVNSADSDCFWTSHSAFLAWVLILRSFHC